MSPTKRIALLESMLEEAQASRDAAENLLHLIQQTASNNTLTPEGRLSIIVRLLENNT